MIDIVQAPSQRELTQNIGPLPQQHRCLHHTTPSKAVQAGRLRYRSKQKRRRPGAPICKCDRFHSDSPKPECVNGESECFQDAIGCRRWIAPATPDKFQTPSLIRVSSRPFVGKSRTRTRTCPFWWGVEMEMGMRLGGGLVSELAFFIR